MNGHRIYISKIQKRMFLLAFATAFAAAFTQTLAVLIDKVIVCAFYGETEIAAVALAGPFFYLLEMPAAGLAAGVQTICAKELGAGQIERMNRKFNQIFYFSAIVLAALTVLSFLFVPQMVFLFGARGKTAELGPYAARYLYGLSFEIIPYVLFCIMTPVVILDNGGRLVTIASAAGCVTDILLDLMSVRFGWGLFGIGLASSASAAVYFLVTMLHFVRRKGIIRLRFDRIRPGELGEIFTASAPKAALSLADAVCSVLFISVVSVTGGVVGACVLSIHTTVNYFILVLAQGIAGAVGVMTGISCGEKNGDDLAAIGALAHRYDLLLSALVLTALGFSAIPLSVILTESEAAAELLVFAFFCIVCTVPFSFLIQARISYLQAIRKIKEAQHLGTGSNLIALAASACLLVIPFGVQGVFLAYPVSKIAVLAVIWAMHVRRTGKIYPPASDYLEVDESFRAGPGDVIDYPIRTREDCALASEQVMMFCRGHKLAERQIFLAGLCVEELTTNVIEHGISPRQTIRTADIRVVLDRGDVIIRARDSGPAFNLKRFAERMEAGGSETGNGIRILVNASKNVSYYRMYGMNTTIIRI